MISHYDWAGGREAMLRFGPATGPVVVAALPLFEEANRTRAFTVTILRELAERGIAGALPDSPGTGESLTATSATSLAKMREAYRAATASLPQPAFSLAIRSGALLDTLAPLRARWHLTPMTGAELLREITRQIQTSARESGEAFDPASLEGGESDPPVEVAGNLVSPLLLAELRAAEPQSGGQVRTIRLATDAKPADHKFEGAPLWRRAEPDNDPALAALLADDIAAWVRACAA